MAGQHESILTGGAGFGVSRKVAPPSANGVIVGASAEPAVGLIGLVLLAVAILIILDRIGFRFAVTAGKR